LPRFLALDWDHQRLHVVAATIRGGRVQIQRAAVWKEDQSPNPAEAEALGRLLRERLKDAGIGPTPVLACVSRDRVILKEVHYPSVPPHEEPAVVQFQVSKELTDAADEVVLDYAPVPQTGTNGEQHALALVIRRELLTAYEALCRGAGLKLVALTPRPFGMLACWKQVVGAESPEAAVALLTVEEDGAEFCIVHRDRLLLTRSLAAGTTLAGEVRRSLAVYAAQGQQPPVRAVYVAGGEEHAPFRARLGDILGIPVHPMDPFAGVQRPEIPAADRGSFVSAVGLLYARAQRAELPINFAQPKKPKPPRNVNKIRLMAAASVAAMLLLGAVGYCSILLAEKQHELDYASLRKTQLDGDLKLLDDDSNRIAALDEWNQGGIVWLDELYDLTSRFPDTESIRLISLNGAPLTHSTQTKRSAKPVPGAKTSDEDQSKAVAKLTLNGITTEDPRAVKSLQERFVTDGHYMVEPKLQARNTGADRTRFQQQFTAHIEIEKQPPDKYERRLLEDEGDGQLRDRSRRRGGSNGRQFSRRGGRP
jgi:Tfp pilus assembly PilM family ATPase